MTDYTNALDLVAKIRAQEVTPERVAMVKEAQAEGVAKVAAIRTKHENNADRGEIMEIKIPFGAYRHRRQGSRELRPCAHHVRRGRRLGRSILPPDRQDHFGLDADAR